MVLDRPDDDAGSDQPDRHFRPSWPDQHSGSDEPGGVDMSAGRASAVESRTHDEYYEALRIADGKPVGSRSADDGPVAGEARGDRSGWDLVDAAERPPPESIRVSPERTTHILDGDPGDEGGGHRHGVGKPGKTEFPASWEDKKIVDALVDVARRPDLPPVRQERNDRWIARRTRDDVGIVVAIARDGRIWTAWPTPDSPGVVKNPKERNGDG